MNYKEFGDITVVRLDVGDELIDTLHSVCEELNIRAAYVTAIGAVKSAVTGVLDVDSGKYTESVFDEFMELVSLIGNVSEMNEQVYIHLHASFARSGGSVVGGHLKSAVVGATGEMFIHRIAGRIDRKVCDTTGLNIFDI